MKVEDIEKGFVELLRKLAQRYERKFVCPRFHTDYGYFLKPKDVDNFQGQWTLSRGSKFKTEVDRSAPLVFGDDGHSLKTEAPSLPAIVIEKWSNPVGQYHIRERKQLPNPHLLRFKNKQMLVKKPVENIMLKT